MNDGLPSGPETADGGMSVGVSGQKQRLKEDHAGGPGRRRPAQKRQHHFSDHRLHEEQEKGADEERDGEKQGHGDDSPVTRLAATRRLCGAERDSSIALRSAKPPRRG